MDIILVFFTDFHRDTLIKVAPETKIVCMDGTHGTNQYGFILVTLMVKDHTGMGCPVGHLICNKESTEIFTIFLTKIREKVGINIHFYNSNI